MIEINYLTLLALRNRALIASAFKLMNSDTANDVYSFQVMWQHILIPDTNSDAYNPDQKTPDFSNWNKYKTSGYMGIYSIIVNTILT